MIKKRAGSRYYWYRFNWQGRRIRASTKCTNAVDARQIEAAHRLRLAKAEAGIIDRERLTLAKLSERFLEHVKLRRPRSERFYTQQTAALLAFPELAGSDVSAIRPRLIARYTAWRRKTVGVATTNRALATLSRMLHLAAEWDLIAGAPVVKLLPDEPQREAVLGRETQALYLDGFTDRQRVALVLMIETGMRPGETLALRWADIHLEDPTGPYILIRRETTKRQKRRAVPLSQRAADALKTIKRTGPHVFGERRKQALSRLQKRNRKVRKALGLPAELVPHSMRHTALTRIGEAGGDAFTIAKIAGHAQITTSQRYVHPVPETLRRAIERTEALGTILATAAKKPRTSKRKAKAASA